MGGASKQSFLKRIKERKRQEKAALKRERRVARKNGEIPEALTEEEASDSAPETEIAAHSDEADETHKAGSPDDLC